VREEEKNADMRKPPKQNRGEERSSNTGATKPQQNRGGEKSSNTGATPINEAANRRYHKERRNDEVLEELQEISMMSLNIRGFNGEEKQQVIGDLIHRENFLLMCLKETKLTIPVYLDNY
jgi:hypothetical protein